MKRPSRRKPLAAACVAAIFALSASSAVHAATYFVTNCDDSGANPGTLRLAANNAVSGDIIDMTGLSSSSTGCGAAVNGFASFMIISSTVTVQGGVTINGPGKSAFAVSAIGTGVRVFTSPGALTINDLGVKYGEIYSAAGTALGGCINTGGDLTLTNVKTLTCNAHSGSNLARGGAVYSAGTVNATGSDFINSYTQSNTTTTRGGAVFAITNVNLTNSSVTCHDYGSGCTTTHATSTTGRARGGAVAAYTGNVVVNGGKIYGNAVVTGAGTNVYGGAIYANGYAYVHGSAIVKGQATTQATASNYAKGGGIFAKGHAYLEGFSAVVGSVAYTKTGQSQGGGIFSTNGPINVKYSVVNGNNALRGGGIYSQGGIWAKYSQFFGNYAKNGGGAMINKTAGNTLVQGSLIAGNGGSGWNAVDAYVGGTSTVTIEQSTISGNSTTGNNPGTYIRAYRTVIDNSTIVYNTSHGTAAGDAAVYVLPGNAGSTIDLNSSLISSNTNDSGNDDLFVAGGGAVTFTAGSSHNLVRNPGGGVPGDTIVGQCPLLHPISFAAGWIFVYKPEMKSPAIDHGSNPLGFTNDQRAAAYNKPYPPRASGPGPNNASPIPDIGSVEIDQNDEIFDSQWETCQ
jgi:hypothetical protein